MIIIWIILFQLVGSLAIVAEILVPSFGLLTAGAVLSFGLSYYKLWETYPEFLPIMILINLISIPVTIYFAIQGIVHTPVTLSDTIDHSDGKEVPCEVGETGIATTDLRPAGKIEIEGKMIDVLSTGEYIEKGTSVSVVEIDNSGIKVNVIAN